MLPGQMIITIQRYPYNMQLPASQKYPFISKIKLCKKFSHVVDRFCGLIEFHLAKKQDGVPSRVLIVSKARHGRPTLDIT